MLDWHLDFPIRPPLLYPLEAWCAKHRGDRRRKPRDQIGGDRNGRKRSRMIELTRYLFFVFCFCFFLILYIYICVCVESEIKLCNQAKLLKIRTVILFYFFLA